MFASIYRASILLLTAVLFSGCLQSTPQPSGDVMYFILIDRFVDGDATNNEGNNPDSYLPYRGDNPEALLRYQGGDILGITQSLDSLKAMGITMLWISPFLDNSNTDYVGWWPYHGYHPIDFYAVDEHFGTLDDLKALVDQAHLRDMRIIFDMPFNQTAPDHPWLADSSKQSWFHFNPDGTPVEITDWYDQQQIEIGELHGLPDLAQENREVQEYLIEVSKYWIKETGCDGFRLDAVKHIPTSFWNIFNQEIKAFAGDSFLLLGEVFWGEPERLAPYTQLGFDLLFDIPGYYAIKNTFAKGSSIREFSEFYLSTQRELGGMPLATLIDNHDVSRFNSGLGSQAWDRQRLALSWLMTRPGLPVIYYGTEIGIPGYPVLSEAGEPQDYLNRIPYPEAYSVPQVAALQDFRALVSLRQDHHALSQGSFLELYKDWSIYAFLRVWEKEQILVVLNIASTQEFLSIPLIPQVEMKDVKQIYGEGALRLENNQAWLRLPPLSMNAFEFSGEISDSLSEIPFTSRYSGDYRKIQILILDDENDIQSIQIAGDFNNWTANRYSSHRHGDSIWVEVPLRPGTYEYKLVLNENQWIADPRALESVLDPFGGANSILRVE